MKAFLASLWWAIYTRWVLLTWHPVRDAPEEYRRLIRAAGEKARARMARKSRALTGEPA